MCVPGSPKPGTEKDFDRGKREEVRGNEVRMDVQRFKWYDSVQVCRDVCKQTNKKGPNDKKKGRFDLGSKESLKLSSH